MRDDDVSHQSPLGGRFMHNSNTGSARYPQMCTTQPTDTRNAAMILVNRRIGEGRRP